MAAIDELISTYLTACEVEGKTVNTVTAYRATLRDFRRVGERLGLPGEVESYTVPDVYTYLAELRERGASAAYQHRRHREVKAYFSWCRRMGLIEENVFARVPLVRLEQKIIEPFSQAEVAALLDSQDRSRNTGCRNYALVLFLLDTGVRASECVGTDLDDVDWEGRRVRILHGKGKKQRWVGFGERTEQALRDYIARFRGEEKRTALPHDEGRALRRAAHAERNPAADRRADGAVESAPAPLPAHVRDMGDPRQRS